PSGDPLPPRGSWDPTQPQGMLTCVAAPNCSAGTFPQFNAKGQWQCIKSCDVVVHFGELFGGATVCTERPNLNCGGLTPTFDYDSEQWTCQPMCDGGLYDPYELDGQTVCIPC